MIEINTIINDIYARDLVQVNTNWNSPLLLSLLLPTSNARLLSRMVMELRVHGQLSLMLCMYLVDCLALMKT